jgi:hypothetical protein
MLHNSGKDCSTFVFFESLSQNFMDNGCITLTLSSDGGVERLRGPAAVVFYRLRGGAPLQQTRSCRTVMHILS